MFNITILIIWKGFCYLYQTLCQLTLTIIVIDIYSSGQELSPSGGLEAMVVTASSSDSERGKVVHTATVTTTSSSRDVLRYGVRPRGRVRRGLSQGGHGDRQILSPWCEILSAVSADDKKWHLWMFELIWLHIHIYLYTLNHIIQLYIS